MVATDLRCQQGQVDLPCDVAVVGALAAGDVAHRGSLAGLQHPQPAVTPGQGELGAEWRPSGWSRLRHQQVGPPGDRCVV